jgi:hypothetical protein
MALETVNIRQGPGETYPVIGQVAGGMQARVTGANSDGQWWRVICPDYTVGDCWVSAAPALTQPAAGDAPLGQLPIEETGAATVESIEIQMADSNPPQVQAVVRSYLPDACTAITGVEQVREGTTFRIRMTTVPPTAAPPADALCAQVITPLEQVIPLDTSGLPAGQYQVAANEVWATFDLTEN